LLNPLHRNMIRQESNLMTPKIQGSGKQLRSSDRFNRSPEAHMLISSTIEHSWP
jgi:hypothetical protein